MLLLRCLAQAILKNAVKSLANAVPFGGALYDITADTWEEYRKCVLGGEGQQPADQLTAAALRTELKRLAREPDSLVRQQVAQALRAVLAEQPPETQRSLTRLTGDLATGHPEGRAWQQRLLNQGMPTPVLELLTACFEDEPPDRPAGAPALAGQVMRLLQGEEESAHAGTKEHTGACRYTACAKAALEKGDYEQAIADCNEALRLDPRIARAYTLRGLARARKGDFAEAVDDYTAALRLAPLEANTYSNRAWALQNLHEDDRAVDDCARAIQLDPSNARAYRVLGLVYLDAGQFDWAIEVCSEAIRLDPGDTRPYVVRSQAYLVEGEYRLAIADCNKATTLDPRLAPAYYVRGAAFVAQRDFKRGLANFIEAIQAEPAFAQAYYVRGAPYVESIPYIEEWEYDRVLVLFTRAIEAEPSDPRPCVMRGSVFLMQGEGSRAIADLTRAILLNPQDAQAYTIRGAAYTAAGKYDQAIADYTDAVRLAPSDSRPYTSRAWAYNKMRQHGRAIADCEEAIRLDPTDAHAYTIRGSAYADQGDDQRAVADCSEAIRCMPALLALFSGDVSRWARRMGTKTLPPHRGGAPLNAKRFGAKTTATLLIVQGPDPGKPFPLDPQRSLIGRRPDSTVFLKSPAVSRDHARVLCEDGAYFVEDAGSSNGTFVNGQKVSGRVPLTEHDKLEIGPYIFTLKLGPTLR